MLFTCQAKKTFGNSPNGSPKIDKRDPFPKLVLEDEFCSLDRLVFFASWIFDVLFAIYKAIYRGPH